jgi:hypothetical protein
MQNETLKWEMVFTGHQLINEPFDFSKKNRMSLKTLHNIVRCVMFPEMVSRQQRFNLTKMIMIFKKIHVNDPLESKFPFYDRENYWDDYVKFLMYGAEKTPMKRASGSLIK